MQPIRSLALSLAGAALLSGCFFESTPEPAPLPLDTSFQVDATLSFEYGGPGSELPERQGFELFLNGAADSDVTALFLSSNGTSSGEFARAGSRLILSEPVALPTLHRPGTENAHLDFEALDLTVLDRDGDGSADAVEGSGSGSFTFFVGDTEFSESFTAEISGELDDGVPPF